MIVIRGYKLTPPTGKPFFAALVEAGEGVEVVSTRNGEWAPEPLFTLADLIMPEQSFNEWDVRRVDVASLPDGLVDTSPPSAVAPKAVPEGLSAPKMHP